MNEFPKSIYNQHTYYTVMSKIQQKNNNTEEKQAYIDLYGRHKKVLSVFKSRNGWVWFVTKQPKTTQIWEGLVRGFYTEFGSFYKSELLDSPDIFVVPREQWKEFEEVIFK